MKFLRYRLADFAGMAGIALIYFVLAKTALAYAAINSVALVWPSSGLALAALLLFGLRLWPGVLAGALLAECSVGYPLWGVALTTLGNTLEPTVGVWLLVRAGFNTAIPTRKDYFLLLALAVVASPCISAAFGSAVINLSGIFGPDQLSGTFFRWWMGNMLGALLAIPLLVWRASTWAKIRHGYEAILLCLLSLLFCAVVFHDLWHESIGHAAQAYWGFPLIIWAALRFGTPGVSIVLFTIHALSLWSVMRGTGYFSQDIAQTGLINCWLYLVIMQVTGMALATTLGESAAAAAILERNSKQLRNSEQRLRKYLEFLPVPLGIVDTASQRFVFVNHRFTELFGYCLEDLPSLETWHRQAYPDSAYCQQTVAEWFALLEQSQASGLPTPHYEVRIACKDGAERVVDLVAAPPNGHLLIAFNDMTHKRRAKELVWRQAHYDALTELPNRRLYLERLREAVQDCQQSGWGLAVLLIDLDRFKEVNDTFGHDAGDLLLADTAKRILSCVGEADTVARLGGDEFTVLLPNVAMTRQVDQVAQAIVDVLAEPFQLGHEQVFVSASIGISCCPDDGTDAKTLLKNADQALFETKNLGRNGFSYFTPAMQEAAQARLAIIRDLRGALANGQLDLFYQPIIDLRNGCVAKAEALLRWRHPVRGLLSPASFISVAEDIGLIGEIGDWVFRQAADQAKRCCERGQPLQISVNKSSRQFLTGHSHVTWLDYLAEIGLPGGCLAIEVSESLFLDDCPDLPGKLGQFRDAGLGVAIDNFGAGRSSLSHLRKFGIDSLKIDRSFVGDLACDSSGLALSEAIIVMAHKLGLEVVAKGVETAPQRSILAAAGCDYAQGFFYSPALPADEFCTFVEDWNGNGGFQQKLALAR